MSSSFGLLRVESHDFSQAEKDSSANKDEQTHKRTTIFTQSSPRLSFWVKMIVILWIFSALQANCFFSAWGKSCDSTSNSQKIEDMCDNYAPQWWVELVVYYQIQNLFAESSQILVKISVIPILLTFMYLGAINLLVNNQLNTSTKLNSSLLQIIDSLALIIWFSWVSNLHRKIRP